MPESDVIGRLHDAVGYRRLIAAFLAGAFSVLAHAPFHLWPILFFTLPVLVWLIDGIVERHNVALQTGKTAPNRKTLFKKAVATGWAFGFGYFLFGLYWIGKAFLVEAGVYIVLMPIAMTLMPAGLALFYALAVGFAALFWKSGLTRVLVLAMAFGLTEWLRGHVFTGFPWNALGHVFAGEAGLSQLSSLLGPYALSFFCLLIFASPAIALHKQTVQDFNFATLRPALILMGLLLAVSMWGHQRLSVASDKDVPDVRLRLVQPNIRQEDKWKPENAGHIYRSMLKWSGVFGKQGGLEKVTHLIWPESALPFLLAHSKEALKGIADLLPDDVTLITGSNRLKTPAKKTNSNRRSVYNSVYVLDGHARITDTYDKKHLVPFGEYLPLQSMLEALGLRKIVQVRGQFETGRKPRLIKLQNAPPFAPLICYEVVFPEELVERGTRPGWLVNLTNDAWYGVSTGPWQHFTQSRIRAIEQGLPMVRVANTGISGVIDPYGRVRQSLPLARAGIIDAALPAAIDKTVYARFGTMLFWLLLSAAAGVILLVEWHKTRYPQGVE